MTEPHFLEGKTVIFLCIGRVLCPYSSIGMLRRAFSNSVKGLLCQGKSLTPPRQPAADNSLGEPWTSPLADISNITTV